MLETVLGLMAEWEGAAIPGERERGQEAGAREK
jgi:hypothetical protein